MPSLSTDNTASSDYLRVEVFDRQSSREAEVFLRAMMRAKSRIGQRRILLNFRLRGMEPMPVLAYCDLVRLAERWSRSGGGRIALVGDTDEVCRLNELAQAPPHDPQLRVRAFKDVPSALDWVLASA